jgi:signal transduction histidine kinase
MNAELEQPDPIERKAAAAQRSLLLPGIFAGLLAVAVAIVARMLLDDVLGAEESFRLFFAAVVFAAWYGGLIPGLVTTALATFVGAFLFVPPRYEFALPADASRVRTFLFVLECTLASFLCASLHRARRESQVSYAEARELERQLLRVSEAEQRRIGRDLHDGLGQQLTGLALMGKTLARRLKGRNVPEADDALRIADLANAAIKHTRELARGLAPLNADALSLPDALQRLAETVGEMARSTIVLRIENAPPPNRPDAAVHLFRITQEALTNAMRHAEATRIEITLDHDGTATLLSIADNGRGLARPIKSPGMGLRLMRYRAKIIGGMLDVVPRSGGGTVVSCRVPDQEPVPA